MNFGSINCLFYLFNGVTPAGVMLHLSSCDPRPSPSNKHFSCWDMLMCVCVCLEASADQSLYEALSRIVFGGPSVPPIWLVIVKAWLFAHYKSNTPIISFVCCSFVAYFIPSSAWHVSTLLRFLFVTVANLQEWSGVNLYFNIQCLKGHLLCKIHFYVVCGHKCELAVCEHIHTTMIQIHPFLIL